MTFKGEMNVKIELKAKFLLYLNQKRQDEGFTLIELLVSCYASKFLKQPKLGAGFSV